MRIEDREDYIDIVAQAVIDRIEERDRISGLVNLVVHKVLELQKEQALLDQAVETANLNAKCAGLPEGLIAANEG